MPQYDNNHCCKEYFLEFCPGIIPKIEELEIRSTVYKGQGAQSQKKGGIKIERSMVQYNLTMYQLICRE